MDPNKNLYTSINSSGDYIEDYVDHIINFNGTQDPNEDVLQLWNNVSGNVSTDYGFNVSEDMCEVNPWEYPDYTQIDVVKYIFVVAYISVIFLSVCGNMMVIWTVWRNKHMRTVTNLYIVNLAVSDFLVAFFAMPLKLLEYTAPCSWHVFNHDGLCSFLYYVLPVFVFTSVLTLVAISIERYYAIVHPLDAMRIHSKKRTIKILALTWIIPMVFAFPYVFCKSYPFRIYSPMYGSVSRQICNDRFDDIDVYFYGRGVRGKFRRGFFMFLFVAVYLVPLVLISVTCVKIAWCLLKPIDVENDRRAMRRREENKRRVARMIIVVAVAFILAWSPFYLVIFISQVQQSSFLMQSNFLFTMLATHLIGFINSCINPIIYNIMSDKFRKSFKKIFFSLFCCCCPKLFGKDSAWNKRAAAPSSLYTDFNSSFSENNQQTQLRSYSACGSNLCTRVHHNRSRCSLEGSRLNATDIVSGRDSTSRGNFRHAVGPCHRKVNGLANGATRGRGGFPFWSSGSRIRNDENKFTNKHKNKRTPSPRTKRLDKPSCMKKCLPQDDFDDDAFGTAESRLLDDPWAVDDSPTLSKDLSLFGTQRTMVSPSDSEGIRSMPEGEESAKPIPLALDNEDDRQAALQPLLSKHITGTNQTQRQDQAGHIIPTQSQEERESKCARPFEPTIGSLGADVEEQILFIDDPCSSDMVRTAEVLTSGLLNWEGMRETDIL